MPKSREYVRAKLERLKGMIEGSIGRHPAENNGQNLLDLLDFAASLGWEDIFGEKEGVLSAVPTTYKVKPQASSMSRYGSVARRPQPNLCVVLIGPWVLLFDIFAKPDSEISLHVMLFQYRGREALMPATFSLLTGWF